MATRVKPASTYEHKLLVLREAANDPADPMCADAIRVLDRREQLMERGYDGEVALDKAVEERRVYDDTAGA